MALKFYKVQYAYSAEVGSPNLHRDEEVAKSEVVHLLGTWLMKNVDSYWRTLVLRGDDHPEFVEAAKALVPEIRGLIGEGRVWEAYDRWHDFYDRFENEFNYPLFVVIGTVIVETTDPHGPVPRRPLMKRSKVPPMVEYGAGRERTTVMAWAEDHEIMASLEALMKETAQEAERRGIKMTMTKFHKVLTEVSEEYTKQFEESGKEGMDGLREFYQAVRKEVLSRLFGASLGYHLGDFQTWLVQYRDFGGSWPPGRHTSEERAKMEAAEYLMMLIGSLRSHAQASLITGRNLEYGEAAFHTADEVEQLIQEGRVWTAYLTYKDFEARWSSEVGEFPLEMSIGTMRVVPDPTAENAA